jgi:PAS domain S-box-containing protein
MWVFDQETLAILAVNAAAVEHYGYSRDELLAMTLKDIRPPEDVSKLLAVDRSSPDRGAAGIWRHLKKDGTCISVDVYTHQVAFDGRPCRLSILRDVTEQKKLEEQLRQSQKMEAIGRLASGIAHDFNNLLTVILGFSDLLAQQPDLQAHQSEIVEIRRAGERAAALTGQLLAFSRKQILSPEVINLNAIVKNMELLLRRVIGEDLELVASFDPDLGCVMADPGQVEQVILNLAVNARDAMPEGGRLTIETRNAELDEAYAREHVSVVPGAYVMLGVSDTGTGMDDYTKARIFEPFFTTKEQGKGTGLGLSTVFGIVKQSGGNIWVYSEPGHGTGFKIYLPRIAEPLTQTRRNAMAGSQPCLAGQGVVLLTEDDEAVRMLTQRTLERLGYRVLAANDGLEALELVHRREPIDILLTDTIMPGMSGPELAAEVASLRPEIKILLMSGYSESAMSGRGDFQSGTALLEKPFTMEALGRKLQELLNG